MTQLYLFPQPTYAELCLDNAKTHFRCRVCGKQVKRSMGIKDKFCSVKHEEVYEKWEKELEEGLRRFEIC
jgi:hypothetical protein